MLTNESRFHVWRRLAVGALALLMTLTVGTALAAVPSTTAYHFSSHPMISGTVVSVNDHEMVVDTDQGERVTLDVDSRTLAPRDLGPGMVMRAEFLALEDCRFYAQRVMPIAGGVSTERLQAYANTRDSREPIASSALAPGEYGGQTDVSQVSADYRESVPQTVGEHSLGPVMTATPTTADYQFSTRPMISGRVVSVNDHRLVVETDQGRLLGLVMDSRTLLPGTVAPGSVVRVDFTDMKDGRHYATRISQIGSGVEGREQAYAHTHDSDFAVAQNTADCGFVSVAAPSTRVSALEPREVIVYPAAVVAPTAPTPVVERPETLPQTASRQPLMLLVGLFALGSAGLVAVARGLRMV